MTQINEKQNRPFTSRYQNYLLSTFLPINYPRRKLIVELKWSVHMRTQPFSLCPALPSGALLCPTEARRRHGTRPAVGP